MFRKNVYIENKLSILKRAVNRLIFGEQRFSLQIQGHGLVSTPPPFILSFTVNMKAQERNLTEKIREEKMSGW